MEIFRKKASERTRQDQKTLPEGAFLLRKVAPSEEGVNLLFSALATRIVGDPMTGCDNHEILENIKAFLKP